MFKPQINVIKHSDTGQPPGDTFFDPSETVTLFHNEDSLRHLERLKLIYHDEPFTLTGYFIVCLIMAFMAWPHTNPFYISAWFISVTVILSIRLILNIAFQSRTEKNIRPQKWQHRLTLFSFITGLTIGTCGLFAFPDQQLFLPLILTVGLITLTSISISSLSLEKNLFPMFLIPALLPITINAMLSGNRLHFGIALLLIIFSLMLLLLEKRSRDNMERAFDARFENSSLLSGLTASKIQLEKKNSELERLVTKDHLTSLANRRHGDEYMKQEWQNAIRHHRSISAIMIDIDKFKYYNDHYGHQMGDDALRTVAEAITQSLSRPSDLPIRYGGEEFLVILPDTDVVGAFKIARRIQEALYKVRLQHEYSAVANYLTICCGVATCIPKRSDKPDSLIKQADIALYKAKFSGGNKAVAFQ